MIVHTAMIEFVNKYLPANSCISVTIYFKHKQ